MSGYIYAGAFAIIAIIAFSWHLLTRKDQKASALADMMSKEMQTNKDKQRDIDESNKSIDKQTDNAIDRLGNRPAD